MDRFTDAELLTIIVALEMARTFVQQSKRVEPPAMFDDIEAKIRSSLPVERAALDHLLQEAIGDIRWIH